MGDFNFETEKAKVKVEQRPNGAVSVKAEPKDFKANGAVEVYIERSRNDDGSVEVIITPNKPTEA